MPKFLVVKIVIRTFETYADTEEEGDEFLLKWQQGETEEAEGGVKATSYKLGWTEFRLSDDQVVQGRNQVLANFLDLMKDKIPGMPKLREESLIIKPFDPFPDIAMNRDKKEGKP